MSDEETDAVRWIEFPIVCPHCGNHGEDGGKWEINAWGPFKLIEEVIRSWLFVPKRKEDGSLVLIADTVTDKVDWESGNDLRFECMQCFAQFPVPEGVEVDFD